MNYVGIPQVPGRDVLFSQKPEVLLQATGIVDCYSLGQSGTGKLHDLVVFTLPTPLGYVLTFQNNDQAVPAFSDLLYVRLLSNANVSAFFGWSFGDADDKALEVLFDQVFRHLNF